MNILTAAHTEQDFRQWATMPLTIHVPLCLWNPAMLSIPTTEYNQSLVDARIAYLLYRGLQSEASDMAAAIERAAAIALSPQAGDTPVESAV